MGTLLKSIQTIDADYYRKTKNGKDYKPVENGGGTMNGTGTSVFDPVLCETQYLWFTKEGDHIIDPFAGGSVRGIIAVELGRKYTGIDLREEQVAANRENAKICENGEPVWITGDSLNIKTLAPGKYDFLFTCPPYGNLEVYSDDPKDLSTMDDEAFDKTYTDILHNAADMLEDDRFACIVVGNYRDKKGHLRDLVGLTVRAMEEAGMHYYNDMIFVTPAGSLPVRVGKAFKTSRKIGKTHQYVLCFIKGDAKKATERLGDVAIPDIEQYETEE